MQFSIASIDVDKVFIPLLLGIGDEYHRAVTTGAMHIIGLVFG